jgi:hypothetical protein
MPIPTQSDALSALENGLAERPVDRAPLYAPIMAYARSQLHEPTPPAARGNYTGAYALRSQAVSWAIAAFYRPTDVRIG